ncbi:hypothetical protein FHG68_16755 [Leptospira weilii]|nr:hypothetical protein FHG67_16710 [Leptospira weilii]QDK28136.1 hypothetical protein FHG68_16755 [Leptospira weilii]
MHLLQLTYPLFLPSFSCYPTIFLTLIAANFFLHTLIRKPFFFRKLYSKNFRSFLGVGNRGNWCINSSF